MQLINTMNSEYLSCVLKIVFIYWFNGKRFEFWCQMEKFTSIINFNHNLYYTQDGYNLIKYPNKIYYFEDLPWNHPLKLEMEFGGEIRINNNGIVYHIDRQYPFKEISRNIPIELKQCKYCNDDPREYLIYYILYDSKIYAFRNDGKNEYFDTKKEEWFDFASNKILLNFDVYIFQDKIYIFTKTDYQIYDPNLDVWNKKIKI